MSPEERDELIQFILQSQSNAAERHREAVERHQDAMQRMDEFGDQLKALASVSRDLVEVARIHSRRLDRLDGLNP